MKRKRWQLFVLPHCEIRKNQPLGHAATQHYQQASPHAQTNAP
jgi:hypothetical protein